MKFKKLVSAVAALAMSASMFAGLATTASAAEETQKIYYIGSESGVETFDNYTTDTIPSTTWTFEKIALNDWLTSEIFFTHGQKLEDGTVGAQTTTTQGVVLENFLTTFAGVKDVPSFAGEGEVEFAICVLEDVENEGIADVFLKKPDGVVVLSTGAFDADVEIDESEFIEIEDSEFDVE